VKKKKAPSPVPEPENESSDAEDDGEISLNVDGPDSESESDDSEMDDQTATLLQGFESSDEEDEEDEAAGQGEEIDAKKLAKAGIPDEKKLKKKLEKLAGKEKVCLSPPSSSPFPTTVQSRRTIP
jgi:nucleolar protein 15